MITSTTFVGRLFADIIACPRAIDLQRFTLRKRRTSRIRTKRLTGSALRKYRQAPRHRLLERGVRLVHEGKTVPQAARSIKRHPSTLRRYLHKIGHARKKGGRLIVPRYRATYWLRIFSEGSFIRVHLDRANAKLAGDYMQAVRQAMDKNSRSFLIDYEGVGVADIAGVFHPFETRMNILYRLHTEQPSETLDLEYEVEAA